MSLGPNFAVGCTLLFYGCLAIGFLTQPLLVGFGLWQGLVVSALWFGIWGAAGIGSIMPFFILIAARRYLANEQLSD